ncbi:MAG: phospholipid carrier-dependent glycosyltransferase [Spirochaetales bacterium]|nr:phospholipid carrier-dependent glycosyltransferase [Spirochaetales bacterium]
MKIKKTVSLVCFIITGFCFSLYAEENLARNGDFEDLYRDMPVHWDVEAWQTSPGYTKYYTESDNPHSGNYYVTIENIQSNDARLVQQVVVKPFTYYRLSCWVKAQGCNPDRTGANISIMHPDMLDTSKDFRDTGGRWEYIEYNVRTGAKQTTMRVAIRLGGFGNDNVGKASFDDFRLEEITDASGVVAYDISKDDGIGQEEGSKIDTSTLFIIIALVILLGTGGLLLYILIIKPKLDKEETAKTKLTQSLLEKSGRAVYTTKDWILAGSLTLIYAIVAFANLGSFKAPQTYWKPVSRGEDVVADLGSIKNVRRVYYFQGLPGGHGPDAKYEVDYSQDGVNWTHIATLGPDTIYYWYYKSTNVQARYIKITVEKPNSWLNEIIFTGEDIKVPLKVMDVYSQSGVNALSKGNIRNLFDEQDTFAFRPSHFTGMSPGFDEQYHARTAMEHIVMDDPYEDTHPPLGKLLMAVGILIFGMTPFGWRFLGTLVGVLMIPIMYAFGKDLFKKTEYAFFAAFLMSVDFMHFTQTRIATIDSYGVFFIILMYFFMYKHYIMSYFTTDFKKTLIPLFLSGVCFGLGCASKWIAVYSVAGLLVLGIVSLVKKGVEYSDMKARLASKTLKKDKAEWERVKRIVDKCPRYIIITLVLSVFVFFIIIPCILYFLSFVPLWFVPEISQSPRNPTIFHWVLDTINGMIDYHAKTKQAHSFSSKWYEWPLMTKPMWYHVAQDLPPNQTQRLFSFGNPAIWWIGSFLIIPGFILSIFGFFRRFFKNIDEAPENMHAGKIILSFLKDTCFKNDALFAIIIGFISNYAFWIISPRTLTFIYHYFASVPFVILCTVALIKYVRENFINKIKVRQGIEEKILYYCSNGFIYAYLLLAFVLFIMFYPIIAGVPCDVNYIKTFLKWFDSWYFA